MNTKKLQILKEIQRLAQSRANDAVRLAFLEEERLEGLDKLDLSALTEFRRNKNGTVEMKFVDRMAALEWLAERCDDPRAKRLYQALEKSSEGGAKPDGVFGEAEKGTDLVV